LSAIITFGELQDSFAPLTSCRATFNSSHCLFLLIRHLFVGQQLMYAFGVRVAHYQRNSQLTLAFRGLLLQLVSSKRTVLDDFASAGNLEPLGCAAVGFHLWHLAHLLIF